MSIARAILRLMPDVVGEVHQRTAYARQQFERGELSQAELDAYKQEEQRAENRAVNFTVRIGADYQGPRCWVRDAIRSPVTALPTAP